MRAAFLLVLLLAAGGYTWVAFAGLDWLSSAGRLGPGYFPRIIGVALLAFCAWGLAEELAARAPERRSAFLRVTLVVAALSGLLVALLEALGGPLAMVLFMAGSLGLLNRGRHAQNAILAIALPAALYLVFRVWLGAAMPRGLLAY